MTKRQMRLMWRRARYAVVIGASIYLATGIDTLENAPVKRQVTMKAVAEPEWDVRILETAKTETESETQIIIQKYDLTKSEDYLLRKIAMAEAGNQDTEGKALVMMVVLNRAFGDNEFPNGIRNVIFQEGQFSPVLEGTFEGTEPDEDCKAALELVQSGWDESQGALFFESLSTSTWHRDNLKYLFQHQDLYFYTVRE